jgi:hypothetical protein
MGRGVSTRAVPDIIAMDESEREELLLLPEEFAFLAKKSRRVIDNMAQRGKIKSISSEVCGSRRIPASELVKFGWTYEMLERVYG